MSESILALLARMPRPGEPGFSEALEALEEFVAADKARDKAHDAWRIAGQRLLARQEALERIINDAGRERDALPFTAPQHDLHEAGYREHDPATCRDGDHYGQCSGVTQ